MEKFNKLLRGFGIDINDPYLQKYNISTNICLTDLIDIMEQVWNMAIQEASDNAEAELELISDESKCIKYLIEGEDYEVPVIRQSILKLKV